MGHHQPASETPFKWCFAGMLMMSHIDFCVFSGVWTRIAKKPYNFVIFQGRGSGPPVPPTSGSAHAHVLLNVYDFLFSIIFSIYRGDASILDYKPGED